MKHRPRTAQTRLLGQINHAYNKTTHMGLQPFAWQLQQDLGPEYKKLNRPLIATLYAKCKQGGLNINNAKITLAESPSSPLAHSEQV